MHAVDQAVSTSPSNSLCVVLLLCSIDNDLVQEDSEFKGSRQFGMSYCSPETGGVAEIGTVLEVTGHSPFDDGRLIVNTRGEFEQFFRNLLST
jgi:hypothetical protein